MNLTNASARAAAALVAGVAGAASFEHIASVAIGAGERTWVGYSLPLAIDGLIVVGVAALLEDKRNSRTGRMSARLAVAVGVLATLAANVASAEPTWTARLVAVAAPVSFLLSVEVLTRSGRPARAADADRLPVADTVRPAAALAADVHPATTRVNAAAEPAPVPDPAAVLVPEPQPPVRPRPEVPAEVLTEVPAEVPVPAPAGRTPQRNNGHAANGSRRPAAVTRQLAADILNAEPSITRKEIAERLGVSTRRLREVLANEP